MAGRIPSHQTLVRAKMKSIFVSCQCIDSVEPQMFISELRVKKYRVDHSPRNPQDGNDSRWADWYEIGLSEAIKESQAFVIVVDQGWDSSTWMGIEADEALKSMQALGGRYLMAYWNPNNIEVRAQGMMEYLKNRLPNEIDKAIEALTRRCS